MATHRELHDLAALETTQRVARLGMSDRLKTNCLVALKAIGGYNGRVMGDNVARHRWCVTGGTIINLSSLTAGSYLGIY